MLTEHHTLHTPHTLPLDPPLFCMHVALTYLWTCLFWGERGANGIGGGGVVVAWHKAELINFSNQFDFLTSFTNLLHLSLNISNIVILFWGSGIGRWVWPDIRAEMIAFSNQFYFLTSWTNIVWKWIWNKEKQTRDYRIGSIHLQHMPIAISSTGLMCWLFVYVIVNPPLSLYTAS